MADLKLAICSWHNGPVLHHPLVYLSTLMLARTRQHSHDFIHTGNPFGFFFLRSLFSIINIVLKRKKSKKKLYHHRPLHVPRTLSLNNLRNRWIFVRSLIVRDSPKIFNRSRLYVAAFLIKTHKYNRHDIIVTCIRTGFFTIAFKENRRSVCFFPRWNCKSNCC